MKPWDSVDRNPPIVDEHAAAIAQRSWREAATHSGERRMDLLINAQIHGLNARGLGVH